MGEREIGAGSFADAFIASGVGRNARLERIDGLFDWPRFGSILRPMRSRSGSKGYPALSLFKALLLQQWYDLSAPGLEEALLDRLSFRRFCGFSLDDETPDETTFVRFRGALAGRGLSDELFSEVNRQLEGRNLILKNRHADRCVFGRSLGQPPEGAFQRKFAPRSRRQLDPAIQPLQLRLQGAYRRRSRVMPDPQGQADPGQGLRERGRRRVDHGRRGGGLRRQGV